MIVTANIIQSKHPVWALRMLANLPIERDKFIPDNKLEEVKNVIHSYLQEFDYHDTLRRHFWADHQMSCMERVFTIQTTTGRPILYIMISDDLPKPGTCAVCDCDKDHACVHLDMGPCWWIDKRRILCSHCALDFDLIVNEVVW